MNGAYYAYKFSTCNKIFMEAFQALINSNPQSCAKFYFEFHINLESNYNPNNDIFLSAPTNFTFDHISSVYNGKMCDAYSFEANEHLTKKNKLNADQQRAIANNYKRLLEKYYKPEHIAEKIASLDKNQNNVSLNIIPHLITHYSGSKYRYLCLPLLLDFNIDSGMVHQGCFIIDMKKKEMIFYEPYGSYKKYDRDYAQPVKEFLEIYNDWGYSAKIYHDLSSWSNQSNFKFFGKNRYGIQSYILDKYNSKKSEYDKDFNELMALLPKDLASDIMGRIKNDKNPIAKTDISVHTIDMLKWIEYSLKINIQTVKGDEKKIYDAALNLFGKYTAKTCVSITLVELDYFFKGNLSELYDKLKVEYPNEVFIPMVDSLIKSLKIDFKICD